MKRLLLTTAVALPLVLATTTDLAGASSNGPTCSGTLDIEVHGQHVVADYVTGIGHENLSWPPSGGVIGRTVASNRGVVVAGGPGPGFHFQHGVAPGASFCTGSSSPGVHL